MKTVTVLTAVLIAVVSVFIFSYVLGPSTLANCIRLAPQHTEQSK